MAASNNPSSGLALTQHDFTSDCYRPNKRFRLVEDRVSTLEQISGYKTFSFANVTFVSIRHNLGKFPIVQVLDTSNTVMVSGVAIQHTDANTLAIMFNVASSGTVLVSI